jgi:hypothetical protein
MILRFVRLAVLAALAFGVMALRAQTTLPFTDSFSTTGVLNAAAWTAVVGPAGSVVATEFTGTAIAPPGAYAVEMFAGTPMTLTPQGVQAKISWTAGAYPAITLDQDKTGGAIALIPSVNGIFNLVANSGGFPGGVLCNFSKPVANGDAFLLAKVGTTYTATDVTTGAVLCSATSTAHTGVPGFQVDNRAGSSVVGPVTITGQAAAVVVIGPPGPTPGTTNPSLLIASPVPPATAWTIGLTNFNYLPMVTPGYTYTFSCQAPVATPAP